MQEPVTRQARVWTAEDVRGLGVRTDLETAASVWGIGRTTAYELARAGAFPCKVIRLGHKYVVPVGPMLQALGIEADNPAESPDPDGGDPDTEHDDARPSRAGAVG